MSLSIVIWMLNFLALTMSVPIQNWANPPSNNKIEIPLDTQFETTTGRGYNCTSPLTTWKSFSSYSEDIETCQSIRNVKEIDGTAQIISQVQTTEVSAAYCKITHYSETCYCGKWYNQQDLASCTTDVNNQILNLGKEECEEIVNSGSFRFYHQDSQKYFDFDLPINKKVTTEWFVTRGSWDAKWATCQSSDPYIVNGDIKTHHFQRNQLTFEASNDVIGTKITSIDGNEKLNIEKFRILPNYFDGSYYDPTLGTFSWNVTRELCTKDYSLLYEGNVKLMQNSNGSFVTLMVNNDEQEKCMWLQLQKKSFVCYETVLSTNQEGKNKVLHYLLFKKCRPKLNIKLEIYKRTEIILRTQIIHFHHLCLGIFVRITNDQGGDFKGLSASSWEEKNQVYAENSCMFGIDSSDQWKQIKHLDFETCKLRRRTLETQISALSVPDNDVQTYHMFGEGFTALPSGG